MEGIGYTRQLKLVRRPFCLKEHFRIHDTTKLFIITNLWSGWQGVGISASGSLAELEECVSGSVSDNQVTVQVTCDFRSKTLSVVPELFWTSQRIFSFFS